jgi:hypothetical protein
MGTLWVRLYQLFRELYSGLKWIDSPNKSFKIGT